MENNQEVYYPDSNRIGKINLPYKTIRDEAERPMLKALHELCKILKQEPHESGYGKTYIVASPMFEPLREGEEIPEYRIIFACNARFEDEAHEQRRHNVGEFGFVAIRNTIVRVPAVNTHTQALH